MRIRDLLSKESIQLNAAPAAPEVDSTHKILAVTACPTGIAHTFMAAESLEQHAKKRGIWIKVETNGSGGAKNVLTQQEIKEADCIIIAADKNVEMARFDGKPVIKTKVANGINKADELLDKALSGQAPIYHHAGDAAASTADEGDNESVGRQIYKHLMNGVSHMLPFVIGGGILIALAFLFDTFDPANPGNFGSNTPLAKFFKDVGGASFGFMLPILSGFISMSIADRPGLAGGEFGVMAAVMAGGMVPPIAIALCTMLFGNRFTESERKSGITTFIMGLSFISEGAIPFAAADPIRVIPSMVAGSAVAGALSMAFDCTLRAPHGGIFVVPTIGNPLMYLAAIAVGSLVGCFILGMLKKPANK